MMYRGQGGLLNLDKQKPVSRYHSPLNESKEFGLGREPVLKNATGENDVIIGRNEM